MSDFQAGTSQEGALPSLTVAATNPIGPSVHSDLAAARAQRQAAVPSAGVQPDSGQATAGSQGGGQQRSEYIPRDRFDEVNTRRIQAEAQLAQLQQMTQGQAQAAAYANHYGQQVPQAQAQATLQSPQVQDFLASLSSKEEQEKWRQKIINQPVTGIAELIQHAIQTEGNKLLQGYTQQIQSSLAPLQQFYVQQQGQAATQYASRRAADPNSGWAQVQPVFNQLVQVAQQRGYNITPQSLEIIEGVARTQVGLPAWGVPQTPQAPFTERPGSVGTQAVQSQLPQLTDEQKKIARLSGMDEAAYARAYAQFRSRR